MSLSGYHDNATPENLFYRMKGCFQLVVYPGVVYFKTGDSKQIVDSWMCLMNSKEVLKHNQGKWT